MGVFVIDRKHLNHFTTNHAGGSSDASPLQHAGMTELVIVGSRRWLLSWFLSCLGSFLLLFVFAYK